MFQTFHFSSCNDSHGPASGCEGRVMFHFSLCIFAAPSLYLGILDILIHTIVPQSAYSTVIRWSIACTASLGVVETLAPMCLRPAHGVCSDEISDELVLRLILKRFSALVAHQI